MEFALPPQAFVNRFVPKSKFFEKAVVNTKLKKEFTDSIQKITWLYKLADETIGIKGTPEVEEIQIFEIQLKEQIIPKNVLRVIDKTIPYPILYLFTYDTHFAYGITRKGDSSKNYYFSDWDRAISFNFSAITLEKVYQGIIKQFIDDTGESDADFDTLIETDKARKLLEREISILKNKITNEKQFNRKVELNKTLQDKKKDLESLITSN